MTEPQGEVDKPASAWKRLATMLLFLVVLVVGVKVLLSTMTREPSYHGKPLRFWLARAATNSYAFYNQKDPGSIECRDAIRSIGTNAVPVLLRIVRAQDSQLRTAMMHLALMQRWVPLHIHSVEEQKEMAALGFMALGDLTTNAVPELVDIFLHSSSYVSKDIAQTALMRLYPAKCVVPPYWLPVGKHAEWYLGAGRALSESSQPSNAVLAFSQAIELEPTNVLGYFARGQTRIALQDFKSALMDFNQVMVLSPSNASAASMRGLCKFSLKDFKGAEADFTVAFSLETDDWETLNYRGTARANLRDFKGAWADFNLAVSLSPYEPGLYLHRAMIETVQTDYELALADASKSIQLNDKDSTSWELRGRIQTTLKNYPAALADEDKALQLEPKNSAAYTARAIAHLCADDFNQAGADLESAMRINPTNFSAIAAKAVLEAKRGDNEAAALAAFERAVELRPQNPDAYGLLGKLEYKLGHWEPALTNCRLALKMGVIAGASGCNACIWLIRAQSGEERGANQEVEGYLNSLDPAMTNDWSALTARFLIGALPETNYLNLAITTAKRPSAVIDQVCDSLYYAAMKRKLAGDKAGELELLQKCLETKANNNSCYWYAGAEMRSLKSQ